VGWELRTVKYSVVFKILAWSLICFHSTSSMNLSSSMNLCSNYKFWSNCYIENNLLHLTRMVYEPVTLWLGLI